jgi:glyoxylase-like metal-dependent hydrolase (beta-lactamase superfamily II)
MSVISRITAVLVATLLVSASSVFPAGGNGTTREIKDGVYSFTLGQGNYSMFLVGEDGVAVFDTFNSQHSEAMLAAIRGVTDKPVKYAFHSHNHWDHASGGQVFKDAGAQTVMHALAAEWLAAHPGRDTASPDMVWSGERHDIKMGGFTVQMHYMGLNHGLGMTVFTIPERRAAFIADLVNPNRVMFAVVPDFNIGEWERTLTEILSLEFDVAVCTHNELPADEALKGCTRTHVDEERQFIRDLRSAILEEFQKGTSFLEVPKAVKLPQYAHWAGYDDWLEMNTLRLMTDLWMGPFPWYPDAE